MTEKQGSLKNQAKTAIRIASSVAAVFVLYYTWKLFLGPMLDQTPTVVDSLRQNAFSGSATIYVLQFSASQGWPFSENEYAALPRKKVLTPAASEDLLDALAGSGLTARRYHNHPRTLRDGLLRIEFSAAEWYYVFFSVLREGNNVYATLKALPRCTSNPNGGQAYESQTFDELVARYGL